MKQKDSQKFAAALRYRKSSDSAPRVTAKGRGTIAERITEIASKEGVDIVEDKDLAAALSFADVGDEIPPELYAAVAEIFSFLYRVNSHLKAEIES